MKERGRSLRRLSFRIPTILLALKLWVVAIGSQFPVPHGNREVQQRSHTFDIVFFPRLRVDTGHQRPDKLNRFLVEIAVKAFEKELVRSVQLFLSKKNADFLFDTHSRNEEMELLLSPVLTV